MTLLVACLCAALPPSSMLDDGPRTAEAVADRRRRAHELGQATERRRQVEARKIREAEELARRVGPLSEEGGVRPSGEGFAMDGRAGTRG